MTYAINLDLLDGKTPADNLKSWLTYTTAGQSFDLLIRMSTASEQRARLKSTSGVADFESAEWWLSHVLDWRELVDKDGAPVAFDPARLKRLYDIDPYFGPWLARECQRFGNFRDAA